MRISDWSSDVCSSDLRIIRDVWRERALSKRSWNADAANGWSGRLLLQDLPRRFVQLACRRKAMRLLEAPESGGIILALPAVYDTRGKTETIQGHSRVQDGTRLIGTIARNGSVCAVSPRLHRTPGARTRGRRLSRVLFRVVGNIAGRED